MLFQGCWATGFLWPLGSLINYPMENKMTTSIVVSSEMITALREKTGAGIMDCKRAIQEASGSMDKAVEILRKKGLADMAKRAGRIMKEGTVVVKISENGASGAMVELNCETDFVSKTADFRSLAETAVSMMLQTPSLTDPSADPALSESLKKLATKMGENMVIRRGCRLQLSGSGIFSYYIHTDGKKGALVELGFQGDVSKVMEDLKTAAKEIALQIVAMSPRWVRKEDVPAEVIEKEKEIYRANAANQGSPGGQSCAKSQGSPGGQSCAKSQGKPGAAVEKMLEGRIKKFLQASCLLEQAGIRDSKVTVASMLSQIAVKIGGPITVRKFENYCVGTE